MEAGEHGHFHVVEAFLCQAFGVLEGDVFDGWFVRPITTTNTRSLHHDHTPPRIPKRPLQHLLTLTTRVDHVGLRLAGAVSVGGGVLFFEGWGRVVGCFFGFGGGYLGGGLAG